MRTVGELRKLLFDALDNLQRAYTEEKTAYVSEVEGSKQNGLYKALRFPTKRLFEDYMVSCNFASWNKGSDGIRRVGFTARSFSHFMKSRNPAFKLEKPQFAGKKKHCLIFGKARIREAIQDLAEKCATTIPHIIPGRTWEESLAEFGQHQKGGSNTKNSNGVSGSRSNETASGNL